MNLSMSTLSRLLDEAIRNAWACLVSEQDRVALSDAYFHGLLNEPPYSLYTEGQHTND